MTFYFVIECIRISFVSFTYSLYDESQCWGQFLPFRNKISFCTVHFVIDHNIYFPYNKLHGIKRFTQVRIITAFIGLIYC